MSEISIRDGIKALRDVSAAGLERPDDISCKHVIIFFHCFAFPEVRHEYSLPRDHNNASTTI